MQNSQPQVFAFPTPTISPPLSPLKWSAISGETPIIIDNGSHNFRAGFGDAEVPYIYTRNEVRKSKLGEVSEKDTFIGTNFSEEILKLPPRIPFDNGLFVNSEVQEDIFDYTFLMLGFSGKTSIDHPVVITEPLCNPNYCRNLMTELLMETYGVKSICYVNDGLSGYYYHNQHKSKLEDGMVVSFGGSSCTVIPISENMPSFSAAKRIDIGGYHITSYLLNILKQRYNEHKSYLTPWLAQYIKENHTYFPLSYLDELSHLDLYPNNIANIIQLPVPSKVVKVQPTKEELEKKQKERLESGKRLKELMQKKRQAKLEQQTEQLKDMEEVMEMKGADSDKYQNEIISRGYESVKEFEEEYHKVYTAVHKHPPNKSEVDVFPLINIPDDQLNAEQLQEKKQQLILKSMSEGRSKALAQKKVQKEKKELQKKIDEEKRKNDPEGWIADLRRKKEELNSRIEKRKNTATPIPSSRRNTSSQTRLHLINMASDTRNKDEDFGANDSDWDIYLQMAKGSSEDDEKDKLELLKIEKLLAKHDPNGGNDIPIESYYQLYLGVDRIRPPELIFQPSLIGLDQMGLTEVVQTVFSSFSKLQQKNIEKNIIVTGGSSMISKFKQRFNAEIRSIRPTKSSIEVKMSNDPIFDSWRGARKFGINLNLDGELTNISLTKSEYSERGISLKPHMLSNNEYSIRNYQ